MAPSTMAAADTDQICMAAWLAWVATIDELTATASKLLA